LEGICLLFGAFKKFSISFLRSVGQQTRNSFLDITGSTNNFANFRGILKWMIWLQINFGKSKKPVEAFYTQ
jgi:hypothetical protein